MTAMKLPNMVHLETLVELKGGNLMFFSQAGRDPDILLYLITLSDKTPRYSLSYSIGSGGIIRSASLDHAAFSISSIENAIEYLKFFENVAVKHFNNPNG